MDQRVSTIADDQGFSFAPISSAKASSGRRRLHLRSVLVAAGTIALLVAAGVYGHYWWTTSRFLVSTDDAYVQTHSVLISPHISGYISEVPVDDNQRVRAGEVLARIDPRDYQHALDQANANVAAAQASIDTLNQQIAMQKLVVEQDRQLVVSDQAALVYSQQNYQRYTEMAKTGAGSVKSAQGATADIREKEATLQHDTTVLAPRRSRSPSTRRSSPRPRRRSPSNRRSSNRPSSTSSYTTITAPVDGTVGVRTLRVGEYVQAGTQLMAVVPLQAVYVTANYKETQLTDVRPGQPVTIDVDTFPGATVHGYVDSLAPASGEEFALLPPDNATGNFTKIVQRIPVKIAIDPNDPLSAGCVRACRSSRRSTPSRRTRLPREGVVTGASDRSGELAVPLKTWIAVGGALIGAFMAVLNIQITNASLPYIEGGIGTGGVYGTWIIDRLSDRRDHRHSDDRLPQPGVLAAPLPDRQHGAVPAVLGRCAARRSSLGEMIVLRALQGFSGGVMIPLAFTIIVTMLPRSKRPMGLAGFAVTATFAPAIGPTIGGWLTDNYGWPTIFYINLAPGVVMLSALIYAPAAIADAARPAAAGRLARHRADGGRARRLPDRARRRQRLRLVRLAVHRQAEPGRRGGARRLRRASSS